MQLTSTSLQIVTVFFALAFIALTVWLWPRAARRSWRAVLGRIGMMAVSQLLILASLLVAANAYFGFYSSWGDLLGTDHGKVTVVQHGGVQDAAAGAVAPVVVTGTQRVDAPHGNDPARAGRIEEVQISGRRTGLRTPALVYLPPEYFQPRYRGAHFPAVVVLTGYPGTAQNLIDRLSYPTVALDAVRTGKMKPTILVMMRPTVAPPRDTEGVDVPGGPQSATYFAQDVPAAVSDHYRTGRAAANWGIIGDSTGGYIALKQAMTYPATWSAAVSLSGYYRAATDPTTGDLFRGDAGLRQRNDLMWRLRHLAAPPVNVLVTTSRHGEGNYDETRAFIDAVKPPMRVASITLPSGGHSFNTWSREIPVALPWLVSKLAAPASLT